MGQNGNGNYEYLPRTRLTCRSKKNHMAEHSLKFSVITVCYNAADTLEETINSVVRQTYGNVEYIIIDGGSTDGTIDIIKKYADKIAYWVSEPDKGMYDALVKGFSRATGDVVCWINADDLLYEAAFATVADFLMQNPEIKWVKGYNVVYNEVLQITSVDTPIAVSNRLLKKGFYQSVYRMPFIQQESTFWRRELMEDLDRDRFRSFKLAGDYYLWYTFAKRAQLHFISSYLGGWRRISGQLSSDLRSYTAEVNSFTERKTPFDWCCYIVDKMLYSLFRGGSIYRRIYHNKMHVWNVARHRFM